MPANVGGMRIHVLLTKRQKELLDKYAAKTGLTVSEHLRRAVDMYLGTPSVDGRPGRRLA